MKIIPEKAEQIKNAKADMKRMLTAWEKKYYIKNGKIVKKGKKS